MVVRGIVPGLRNDGYALFGTMHNGEPMLGLTVIQRSDFDEYAVIWTADQNSQEPDKEATGGFVENDDCENAAEIDLYPSARWVDSGAGFCGFKIGDYCRSSEASSQTLKKR